MDHPLKIIKRNQAIIRQILLPSSTLQSVGDAWGISRERVRQIIKKGLPRNHRVIKADLLSFTKAKFRCLICGTPINPIHNKGAHRIYCSKKCYHIAGYYDWKNEAKCIECNCLFFPHRNAKWQRGRGIYCSRKCYMIRMKKENIGKPGRLFRRVILEEEV